MLASEDPPDLNVLLTVNDRNVLLVERAPTKHLSEPMSHGLQDLICSKTFFPNMPEVNASPAKTLFYRACQNFTGEKSYYTADQDM